MKVGNIRTKQLVSDLKSLDPPAFASRWVLECVPYLFNEDRQAYVTWKTRLGKGIGVDPYSIIVVGNACTGVSLNPNKRLKPFDAQSDIDVAVISAIHFDISWHWLRSLGAKRHGLPVEAQRAVSDHVTRLIYWGTIATDKILGHLPFGPQWTIALSDIAAVAPTEDREVKLRLYRDVDSLRAYQIMGIRSVQEQVLASGA